MESARSKSHQSRTSMQKRKTGFSFHGILDEEKKGSSLRKLFRQLNHSAIKPIHKTAFKILSIELNISMDKIENYSLCSPNSEKILDKFASGAPPQFLIFYHKLGGKYELEVFGETVQIELILTDGKNDELDGECFYFLKHCPNPGDADTNNVVLHYGYFKTSCATEEAMKSIICPLTNDVFMPAFRIGDDWTAEGFDNKKNTESCIAAFGHFLTYVSVTDDNIKALIKLESSATIDLSHVKNEADCKSFVKSAENVATVELVMRDWTRTIAESIAESDEVRREADDVGPMHELQYWRYNLCRFSSITACVKSEKFKTVVNILNVAKSREMKVI